MQRKILAAAIFALFAFLPSPSFAQISPTILPSGCGTGAATGSMGYLTVDSTLKLCVNATVSASITGFPTVQSTGTPIAVTAGGVTGTLPTGAVVVASNVGATNGAYCKLGASATTSDQLIPPNSWFSFTVGANTQLTCITSTSTTTVNMVGGSGLPTGSGGGGGGGSGGAVTLASAAVAPGAYQAGALLDVTGTAATTAHGCAITGYGVDSCLGQIDDDIKQAGSINQATNGTTNGVSIVGVNSATALGGAGAVGAGAQRIAVGQDATTIAGSAPVKGGVAVVNGGSFYQAVAASATATVLQSSAGAAGDYLSHCTIYPTSTSPGVVTVFDSTNTAANSAILFPGGTSSLSNLAPFAVPVGAVSVGGAWKVTTGANVSVVCYGKFS